MTDTASTDPSLTDLESTDLGPFFKRHDRQNRLVLGAATIASLTLSAVIAARLVTTGGSGPKDVLAWRMGVAFPPLFIGAWWTFGELMTWGRRKQSRPDGSYPAGAADARNGVRLANAGFAFSFALIAASVMGQALMATMVFGYQIRGDLISRAIMVAVGAATIYFGNLYPRMPTPRAPGRAAAVRLKTNRISGWAVVIAGLLIVLVGLFLPLLYPDLGRHHP